MLRTLKVPRLRRSLSPIARAVRERRLTYLRPERLLAEHAGAFALVRLGSNIAVVKR